MCLPNWHGRTANISSLNDSCVSHNIRPSKMAQIPYCAPEIISLRAYQCQLDVMSSISTFSLLSSRLQVTKKALFNKGASFSDWG